MMEDTKQNDDIDCRDDDKRFEAARIAVELLGRTNVAGMGAGAPVGMVVLTYRELFDAVLGSLRGEPAAPTAKPLPLREVLGILRGRGMTAADIGGQVGAPIYVANRNRDRNSRVCPAISRWMKTGKVSVSARYRAKLEALAAAHGLAIDWDAA